MKTKHATIDKIIESAILWISDDTDNPATPPEDWQRVIPLLKAASDLLEVANWLLLCDSEGLLTGGPTTSRALNAAKVAIAKTTGDPMTPPTYQYHVEIPDPQGGSPHVEYSGPIENAAKTALRRVLKLNRSVTAYKVDTKTGVKTPLTL